MHPTPAPSIAPDLLRIDADGPVLVGGRSASSGLSHFPRLDTCPYTGATDVEPVDLPRTGRLWLWTAVTAPPPGYSGPVPYGFGVVELDGGLRVVTRLTESDPAALHEGQRVHLVVDTLGDGDDAVATWAFAPSDEASR